MRKLILIVFCILPLFCFSGEDYTWWNEIHGWEPGMPGWRNWMRITPGYFGPNALPVPEVKKGIVPNGSNLEFGFDFHFQTGDPTQNISGKYYRAFCENKIAIEIYGILAEHYAMSDSVRDARISRDYDGEGFAVGDVYFSTLIQLLRGRKFPDTMLRMACRTTSGNQLEGARFTDFPGYFFDLSFSKEYYSGNRKLSIRPLGSLGFYTWQTNDELNLQNDAYMYAAGADFIWSKWTLSNSLSGYTGYKHERDKPIVYTFDLNRSFKKNSIRLQYLHGFRDWNYNTIKLSYLISLRN